MRHRVACDYLTVNLVRHRAGHPPLCPAHFVNAYRPHETESDHIEMTRQIRTSLGGVLRGECGCGAAAFLPIEARNGRESA